jgi:hypothetical protein
MSMEFWFGFVAGFVTVAGILLVYVFLPEGDEPRKSREQNENDCSVLTS